MKRQLLAAYARVTLVGLLALAAVVPPAAAQEYDLFDKFAVTLSAGESSYDTKIRLDSKILGIGTEIDLEDGLGVDDSKTVPALRIDWQLRRKQRLYLSWSNHERTGRATASDEIIYGDLVIPVDVVVDSTHEFNDYRLGYAYYPIVRERSAFGIGLGIRLFDYVSRLEFDLDVGEGRIERQTEEGETAGPFPFIGFEWRYAMARKWRFVTDLGWFQLKIGDYDGGQLILDARIEHLVTQRFAWGLRGAVSQVDLDFEDPNWSGKAEQDIAGAEIFVRARW